MTMCTEHFNDLKTSVDCSDALSSLVEDHIEHQKRRNSFRVLRFGVYLRMLQDRLPILVIDKTYQSPCTELDVISAPVGSD